jgi:hypothetical protein
MNNEVRWISRHDLSPAQRQAILDLHGEDAVVVKDSITLEGVYGIAEYVISHPGSFVYVVGSAEHYIAAALSGMRFGIFKNYPGKRQDGEFGLQAVFHVENRTLSQVWVNSNPESDTGEALIPVSR